MENKKTTKLQEIASTVVAVVIALAAIVLIVFSLIHAVSILKAGLFVALGFAHAFLQFVCGSKWLKRIGAKPWMNNKWTWLAILVLGAVLVWYRGALSLWPMSYVLFLRLFISPDKQTDTVTVATKSS